VLVLLELVPVGVEVGSSSNHYCWKTLVAARLSFEVNNADKVTQRWLYRGKFVAAHDVGLAAVICGC
jgi:hypothetical protein